MLRTLEGFKYTTEGRAYREQITLRVSGLARFAPASAPTPRPALRNTFAAPKL